ncbi:MAG: hypothetical protein IKZ64_02610 [Alphaproteobacteria bacterium]|nr:hypothetical protein [Alphaproteobacteria bacterium]
MNIIFSEDLNEYVVINFDYMFTEKELSYIKTHGERNVCGITFFYRELLTLGEIRARIGKFEPLVAVYIMATDEFYMFHSQTKTMSHRVNH